MKLQKQSFMSAGCLASLIALAGCANVPSNASATAEGARTPTQAVVDLSNAHVDKRKFLIAASLLGTSPARDGELLSKMAGAPVEPRPRDAPEYPRAQSVFNAIVNFNDARLINRINYHYAVGAAGEYLPRIDVDLNKQFDCVRIGDLKAALGEPAKVVTQAPLHATPTGRSDVWTVLYAAAGGANVTFAFHSHECAFWVYYIHSNK